MQSSKDAENVLLENAPQGDEYIINARNQVLHLRTYAPEKAEDVKALVLFVHGYGGHCNSRTKVKLGKSMPEAGLAVIMMDLPGHGYSQGNRADIKHYSHWIDDYLQLMEAAAGGGFTKTKGHFSLSPTHLEQLTKVPFFLAGESLGGGLSLLVGLSLYDRKHAWLPRFKGVGLIAPAIKGNLPPASVVALLRYLVVPILPGRQVPDFLESVKLPTVLWKEEADRARAKRDAWGNPGGIGWGHNTKLRMAMNMIDMIDLVHSRLSDVCFPFLIMHDPADEIVQFGPSKELMEKASTPRDDPRNRELKEMDGWLHDLLTNCPDEVINNLQDWFLHHTERDPRDQPA